MRPLVPKMQSVCIVCAHTLYIDVWEIFSWLLSKMRKCSGRCAGGTRYCQRRIETNKMFWTSSCVWKKKLKKRVQVGSKLSSLSHSLSTYLTESEGRERKKTNQSYRFYNQLTSVSPPIDLTVYFVRPLESVFFFFTRCHTSGDSCNSVMTLDFQRSYFSYLKETRVIFGPVLILSGVFSMRQDPWCWWLRPAVQVTRTTAPDFAPGALRGSLFHSTNTWFRQRRSLSLLP